MALFPLDEECPTEPAAQERAERPPPSATHAAVAALLQPSPKDQALYNAALMAAQASSGSLELTAQMLARLGYAVTLNTSAGGTLHSLKHRYLTATRTSLAGS
jgi:hypothetical protein